MKKLFIYILALLLPLTAFAVIATPPLDFNAQIQALEKSNGGQIGVAALNTANNQRLEYRAQDRFALCSTHKLILVAAVLARVDQGVEDLSRQITYTKTDLQEHAPITKQHLKDGSMSIADLSAAAIEYSDNTAANLLLQSIGGPKAFTDYVRSLGDTTTQLDRNEPTLNTNLPGDQRDTTTPSAMIDTLHSILIGNALLPGSKEKLITWLIGNTTGDQRIRAGINTAWRVGDKTGTGENGATSDVAIIWPPNQKSFLVAVYYSGATTSLEKRNRVIADVSRIVRGNFYPDQTLQ